MDSYVSVSEAARLKKVTRQAIYLAIRLNKLKAYQHGDTLKIFRVDLDEYDKHRYSRTMSVFNGEPLFDDAKGHISVEKAAKLLGIPKQKVYYACRTGALKAVRKRCSWVICVEDLLRYQDEILKKDFTQKMCS